MFEMNGISFMEVPSEIGAGCRGASLGIDALKMAAFDRKSDIFKNTKAIDLKSFTSFLYEPPQDMTAKYIENIFVLEERVCDATSVALSKNDFLIVLAGDHASAYGTIAGIKKECPQHRLGVIWIDAHADMHSPYTSPSGNIHGMPLAMACGLDNIECRVNNPHKETIDYWERIKNIGFAQAKIKPTDIVYIALRAHESSEKHFLDKCGIKVITVEDVRKNGVLSSAKQALATLHHCDTIYTSFDVDSMDPSFSRGTGTSVPLGLKFEEALALNTEIVKDHKVCVWEIAEINPILDSENKMAKGAFDIVEQVIQCVEQCRVNLL